jgi:hypothetical protein
MAPADAAASSTAPKRQPAATGRVHKFKLREQTIEFLRGPVICGCQGSPGDGAETVTRAVAPLAAKVIGRLFRYEKRPPSGLLTRIRVKGGSRTVATLASTQQTLTVDLEPQAGALVSKKKILLWFGQQLDLQGAAWDDILLLNINAGGALPFDVRVKAQYGATSRNLGLLDVLIEDPDDAGNFRTARYGVFRTRTPHFQFVAAEMQWKDLQVFFDDGENETLDEVDATALVNLSGDVTALGSVPGWISRTDERCRIKTNQDFGVHRLHAECIEPRPAEGDCALIMYGENRIQIFDHDELLFCSHSLHYLDANETVPSGFHRRETVGEGPDTVEIIKGSLALDFQDTCDDAQLSHVLHALELRPRSYAGHYRIVEGHSHEDLDFEGLKALRDRIDGFEEPELESLSLAPISPLDPVPSGMLEKVPTAFHGDFVAANNNFTNRSLHWHHFVIHTFPALRLIESVLFPDTRPPMVAIGGVQFETNKTFIRPGAADGVRNIVSLVREDATRKIAIFGHTDREGSDAHNNQLSLLRAQSMEALLKHRAGWWYDRFAAGSEKVGTNKRDQQWSLKELGYYAGPIMEADNAEFIAALHRFQSDHGIPQGSADLRTRGAMADALRARIGATSPALANESTWGTREIQSMLKQLGHYAGEINGSLTPATRNAIKAFQRSKSLLDDGSVGIATRIALIQDYMKNLVPSALPDARFHPNAVFGCGEAFPRVPTPDNVESVQNRRVEVILRRNAIEPIDPAQLGAAAPYVRWIGPDFSDAAPPRIPSVVVAVTDSGLGNGNNFTGEQLTQPNRLFITGERLIRPTDVSGANAGNPRIHTVFRDGDLTGIPEGSGHGTAVITCMAADGIGDAVGGAARTFNNFVVGTAPHVKVRPIRTSNDFWTNMLALEVMASDPEVFVHATSAHLYRTSGGGVAFTNRQWRALEERIQDLVMQGKVALASAGNYRTWLPGEYDTATRQFGRNAPDRRFPRSHAGYNGAHEHRRRISIVGSTAEVGPAAAISAPGQRDTVANHTYLGEQVTIHMPGENIRAISPAGTGVAGAMTAPTAANGMTVGGIGGTSFATPMTAGVVAELMLLDPALTQPANIVRALEYVEATADPLPNVAPAGGQGAPANPRNADPGANAGGPPAGPQSPTAATTYQNIRRVHYWKSVLAALNRGLSSEGRGANGAQDAMFTFCTLRDDSATQWYGFELRSRVPNALVWFRKPDGSFVQAEDAGALFPASRITATAWRTADAYQLAANQPLPSFPWTQAEFTAAGRPAHFLCQMSIKKDKLAEYQAIVLHLPGVDPLDPEGAEGPPILEIRVGDRPTLRNPAGAAGAPEVWKQAINTFVLYDDFIFHVTATPQPLHHFQFFVEDNRRATAVGETVRVLLYAVDRFGFLTNPGAVGVNVTHNGTPGATGPNRGVFLNGAPAAAAGVAPGFGAGADPPGLARLRFQGFNAETVTLSINDGAGHTGSVAIQVRPAGALHHFTLEIRRRGGGASVVDNPPRTAEPLEVVVTAVDDQGIVITTFTGAVTLSVTAGESGSAGPPPRGVHVKTNAADPFDPAAFTHNFTPADSGIFAFPIFDFSAGRLQLKASMGAIEGTSREIRIGGGTVAAFLVQAATPQTVGNTFDVVVTAVDAEGNRIDDFQGAVTLGLVPGSGTAGAIVGGVRQGVFVGGTSLPADDTYTFVNTDGGVHNFPVTCYTAELVRFRASHTIPATGAVITADSADIRVNANALHHFGFEARGADRAGTAFELEVIAQDASNKRVPGFVGNVTLNLAAGTAFGAGPPPVGVRIETAVGVAGNMHAFVAADNGSFTFRITPNTAETIRFQAVSGAVSSNSPDIAIESGAVHHFQVAPAAARRNVPFNVVVTAQDVSNNTVRNFLGAVSLRVRKGVVAFAPIPGASHTFGTADRGTFTYAVTLTTSGAGHAIEASDGNTTSQSAPFNVAP